MTRQLHEEMYFLDVDTREALLHKIDRAIVRSVYRQMEGLFPIEYEAFALAYPLHDATKVPDNSVTRVESLFARLESMRRRTALQHKEIAGILHLSQSTVSRRLKRARNHFLVLYIHTTHAPMPQ